MMQVVEVTKSTLNSFCALEKRFACFGRGIGRLVHGTYFSVPSHPMGFPSKYNSIKVIKFMKI